MDTNNSYHICPLCIDVKSLKQYTNSKGGTLVTLLVDATIFESKVKRDPMPAANAGEIPKQTNECWHLNFGQWDI